MDKIIKKQNSLSVTKLKSCPFCGSKKIDICALEIGKENFYQVLCTKCNAIINNKKSEKEAIICWNTRSKIRMG